MFDPFILLDRRYIRTHEDLFCKLCVQRNNLVHSGYHTSKIEFEAARITEYPLVFGHNLPAESPSTAEVEKLQRVRNGVNQEVARGQILVGNAELQVEVVNNLNKLLKVLEFKGSRGVVLYMSQYAYRC